MPNADNPTPALSAAATSRPRHAEWESEVDLEVIRAVAEREKRSLLANMIGWFACVAAAFSLPEGEIFTIPIILRLFSILYVRFTWSRFRSRIEAYEPYEKEMALAQLSLAISGFFWGLLIFPLTLLTTLAPPALVILTVATIGISLVSAMLGSLPRLLIAYYTIFTATLLTSVFISSAEFNWWIPMLTVLAGSGIISYALGSGREHRASAETLVENRRLGYELTRALSRAEYLAERDPLTGLLNRRAFFDRNAEIDTQESQFILALDLDHFKKINDAFGHAVGDRVLEKTAAAIRQLSRELPAGPHHTVRLGGEEFAVQLVGVDRATAVATAEALRERIARIPDHLEFADLDVSVSIGVTAVEPGDTIESAIASADAALYEAKKSGRNQVIAKAA